MRQRGVAVITALLVVALVTAATGFIAAAPGGGQSGFNTFFSGSGGLKPGNKQFFLSDRQGICHG